MGYHSFKREIELEDVLSEYLIQQIKDQIKVFVAGMEYKRSVKIDYKISLGKIMMPDKTFVDNNNVEVVVSTVSNYYHIPLDKIISRHNRRSITEARQMLQTMLAKYTQLSLSEIGRITGGFKHCTVLYSQRTVHDLYPVNMRVKKHYDDIDIELKKLIKRAKLVKGSP